MNVLNVLTTHDSNCGSQMYILWRTHIRTHPHIRKSSFTRTKPANHCRTTVPWLIYQQCFIIVYVKLLENIWECTKQYFDLLGTVPIVQYSALQLLIYNWAVTHWGFRLKQRLDLRSVGHKTISDLNVHASVLHVFYCPFAKAVSVSHFVILPSHMKPWVSFTSWWYENQFTETWKSLSLSKSEYCVAMQSRFFEPLCIYKCKLTFILYGNEWKHQRNT